MIAVKCELMIMIMIVMMMMLRMMMIIQSSSFPSVHLRFPNHHNHHILLIHISTTIATLCSRDRAMCILKYC